MKIRKKHMRPLYEERLLRIPKFQLKEFLIGNVKQTVKQEG